MLCGWFNVLVALKIPFGRRLVALVGPHPLLVHSTHRGRFLSELRVTTLCVRVFSRSVVEVTPEGGDAWLERLGGVMPLLSLYAAP